jgi:polyribonucleotide nucleotidyltransferase
VEDVLKEGQEIEVKIIDIDPKSGKIKLSRKELLPRPPRPEPKKESPDQNQNK